MGLAYIRHQHLAADAWARVAGHGISQAVGPSASPCAGGGSSRGFSKNFPELVVAIARSRGLDPSDIEIWFGDEARIGQKNKITRRWAPRGSRPSAPHD